MYWYFFINSNIKERDREPSCAAERAHVNLFLFTLISGFKGVHKFDHIEQSVSRSYTREHTDGQVEIASVTILKQNCFFEIKSLLCIP